MRLINAKTVQVQEFPSDESVPAFAILSHTWSDQECTLRHMEANVKDRMGYAKIEHCCRQALKDGLQWVWVDT
jgi:hypothetical protein